MLSTGIRTLEDKDIRGNAIDGQLLPNRSDPFDSDCLPAIFDRGVLGGDGIMDILQFGLAGNTLGGRNRTGVVSPFLIVGIGDIGEKHSRHDEQQIREPFSHRRTTLLLHISLPWDGNCEHWSHLFMPCA